jgi:hypothetical protein
VALVDCLRRCSKMMNSYVYVPLDDKN